MFCGFSSIYNVGVRNIHDIKKIRRWHTVKLEPHTQNHTTANKNNKLSTRR